MTSGPDSLDSIDTSVLVCPLSRSALELVDLDAAEKAIGATLSPAPRTGRSTPVGRTAQVLLRADRQGAYPVLADGIPVLLGPEILVPAGSSLSFDLDDPVYQEAYAEMDHYDAQAAAAAEKMAVGDLPPGFDTLLARPPASLAAAFPSDWKLWLDAEYDCLSQNDCFVAFGSIAGHTIAQIGGTGMSAVKFLLAGAERAVLIAPMAGELRYAVALAKRCGVADRLMVVAALAEQLPFVDSAFDGIYSPGCLHHMVTELAVPELHRTLRPGGAFAAAEPWRASLYGIGVKLLGRREAGAHCSPLTPARVAPLRGSFEDVTVVHHGALTRYPSLALAKARLFLPIWLLFRLFRIDDAITRPFGPLRRQGSSVSVVARRSGVPGQAAPAARELRAS